MQDEGKKVRVKGVTYKLTIGTCIEQIENEILILSGGISQHCCKLYEIQCFPQNQKFTAISQRGFHRTVFDGKKYSFLISGNDVEGIVQSQCEVFNLHTSNFKQIQSIKYGAAYFGTSLKQNQIFVFGGYNFRLGGELEFIQFYDISKNE